MSFRLGIKRHTRQLERLVEVVKHEIGLEHVESLIKLEECELWPYGIPLAVELGICQYSLLLMC